MKRTVTRSCRTLIAVAVAVFYLSIFHPVTAGYAEYPVSMELYEFGFQPDPLLLAFTEFQDDTHLGPAEKSLKKLAQSKRSAREWVAVSSLVVGSLAAFDVVSYPHDDNFRRLTTGFLLGGGIAGLAFPFKAETEYAQVLSLPASQREAAAADTLKALSDFGQQTRIGGSLLSLVAGAIVLSAADSSYHYYGYSFLLTGVFSLLMPSSEEQAYATYRNRAKFDQKIHF